MNPISLFNAWYSAELELTTSTLPSACCLSTNGLDGFPNSRFVSLKAIIENGFVITTVMNSRKANEIVQNDKVALAFWWPDTKRQVRIQGYAEQIDTMLSEKYFAEKEMEAQIITTVSRQGEETANVNNLRIEVEAMKDLYKDKALPCPAGFGGYNVKPIRIEFMQFQNSRLHDRTLFEAKDGDWQKKFLQP